MNSDNSDDSITIEEDVLNTPVDLSQSVMQLERVKSPEPEPVDIPAIKVDKRKISSRINIQKARDAKARKRIEENKRMQELFGDSDSESDYSEDDDTDSDDEPIVPTRYQRKKKSKEQHEIAELKDMLFKLAAKQKRDSKRRRRRRSPEPTQPQQHTPIINYTIAAPPTPPVKPVPKKDTSNAFMRSMLKSKIIDN